MIDENEFDNTEEDREKIASKLSKETEMNIDEVILREFHFCFQIASVVDKLKDSMIAVRGTTSKSLNTMLNTMLEDTSTTFDENNLLIKRPPPYSVHLDHVYGFQVPYIFIYLS